MSIHEQPASTTTSFSYLQLLDEMEQTAPFPYSTPIGSSRLVNGYSSVFLNREPSLDQGKPTLYLLIGPSGVGQDTLMEAMSNNGMQYVRLRTATTRTHRSGEANDAYIWMDEPKGLTQDEAIVWLTERYDLAECQYHCGSYYGTPISSIEDAAKEYPQLPIVAKTECAGAESIASNANGRINVVTIGLVPEGYRQLWARIANRGNVLARMLDAMKISVELSKVAHYVVCNREVENDPDAGINSTAWQLSELILGLQVSTSEGIR